MTKRIRILILAANPKNTVQLRLYEEVRELDEGLRHSMNRDRFDLNIKWAIRPSDVRRAILEFQPHIVHFTGHGEGSAIVFENDMGESKFVSAEAFAELFKLFSDSVKCVMLNGCYSEVQAKAIAQYIYSVIGMTSAISDRAATEFSIGFYDALGAGRSIEDSYQFGCNATRLYNTPKEFIPVLIRKGKYESFSQAIIEDRTQQGIKKHRYEQASQLLQRQKRPFEFIRSPYRSGNLIQELGQGHTNMFFGRDETIQKLKQILIRHDDSLVILYGQRRTGKSCLMKYIETTKIFGPDLPIILIDMQGILSEQRFYESILSQIQAIIHSNQQINAHINSFDEFTNSLNTLLYDAKIRFLIMIDEFECVIDTHFKYTSISDGYEFIQRIRNMIQHTPNVKFALAGTDGLKTMIDDHNNPLFKPGRTLHIAFLHSRDAKDLIVKPLAGTVSYTGEAVALIQEATYNHPYYIQCICQQLLDILNENERYTVTETDVKQAIDDLQKTDTDMFKYVWDITEQADHIILAIIAQEINSKTWVSIDRIEDMLNENSLPIQGSRVEDSIKKLIQKEILQESDSGLEYTIPIGLLRTWIKRYKPFRRVRREFSV